MSQATANIYLKNSSAVDAILQIYHYNVDFGVQGACYYAKAGTTVGPLEVPFRVGLTTGRPFD